MHVKRDCALASGLSNLGDWVRLIDRDGTDLEVMIVAEAQRRAAEQGGELYLVEQGRVALVRIVLIRKAPGAHS